MLSMRRVVPIQAAIETKMPSFSWASQSFPESSSAVTALATLR